MINKKRLINSIIASIGFVSFEGVFWKLGNNIFNENLLSLTGIQSSIMSFSNGGANVLWVHCIRPILFTLLCVFCFAVFIYFTVKAVRDDKNDM